jgi:hypothetical protein
MNIFTLTLLLISISALPGNAPKGGNALPQSADEKPETSGTFHLSDKEPRKHLSLRGKTGIVKINNIGPAALAVKNSLNNVTLGANTQMNLTFEGDTDLSISRSGSRRQANGTFEICVKE